MSAGSGGDAGWTRRAAMVSHWLLPGRLPPMVRRASVAWLVVLALLPFLSAGIALRQGWEPVGDVAVIGLRAHDVLSSHPPSQGQPTTGDLTAGQGRSNSPGPAESYLLAPAVAVFGIRWGLLLGVAAINGLALGFAGWVAFRRGGPVLLALTGLGLVALAASLGPGILHTPINSEVGDLAMPLVLLLGWSVWAGDDALLPLLVGVASLAAQVHVGIAAFALPVCLVAAASWSGRAWFRRGSRRPLIAAALVTAVCWLPVACSELLGSGQSNLAALVRFAFRHGHTVGPHFAVERVATAVAPIPIFARPTSALGFLHDATPWQVLLAYLLLGTLGTLTIAMWARRPAVARLAGLCLVVVVAGAINTARLPLRGSIRVDGNRWLWTASFATWLTLAWFGWLSVSKRIRRTAAPGLIVGTLAVGFVVSALVLAGARIADERDAINMAPAAALSRSVRRGTPRGTYRIQAQGSEAFLAFAPSLVADLDSHGYRMLVDLGTFDGAYGAQRTYTGQSVAGRLLVTTDTSAAQPSGARLLGHEQTSNETVRVYLVPK